MMKADVHETAVIPSLRQVIEVEVSDLNAQGYADYVWTDITGSPVQLERKTWNELASGMDDVERQLHGHLTSGKGRTIWLLEGIVLPTPIGTDLLLATSNPGIYRRTQFSSKRISLFYAWLYQISKFCEVYFSPNIEATAIILTTLYKADQKEKHDTLHRHLKAVTFHPNPQVEMLMALLEGVGPARAEALVKQFGTVWNVVSAPLHKLVEVDGIGVQTAAKFLHRIGRPDIT